MNVIDLMHSDLPPVGVEATLQEAAQALAEAGVSVLPVHAGPRVVAAVSLADLTLRGCASGLDPASAIVADVMTEDLPVCAPDTTAFTALGQMARTGVDALIVHGDDDARVLGVVTLQQVTAAVAEPSAAGPLPAAVKRVRGDPA